MTYNNPTISLRRLVPLYNTLGQRQGVTAQGPEVFNLCDIEDFNEHPAGIGTVLTLDHESEPVLVKGSMEEVGNLILAAIPESSPK